LPCPDTGFALAVFERVIEAVDDIEGWLSQGAALYARRVPREENKPSRCEFVNTMANGSAATGSTTHRARFRLT
jgi:hypothetical protein